MNGLGFSICRTTSLILVDLSKIFWVEKNSSSDGKLRRWRRRKKLKKEKRRHFFLVSSSSSSEEDEEENVVDVKLQLFFCCVSMPTLINHYVYPSLSSWDEPVISIRLSVRPSAHLKNALDFPVVFVDKTSAFCIMANSSWYVVWHHQRQC